MVMPVESGLESTVIWYARWLPLSAVTTSPLTPMEARKRMKRAQPARSKAKSKVQRISHHVRRAELAGEEEEEEGEEDEGDEVNDVPARADVVAVAVDVNEGTRAIGRSSSTKQKMGTQKGQKAYA